MEQDQKQLIKLAHTKMPFGKYEGKYLIDLPEYYVVWYSNKGFPKGELGQQLQLIYELKLNGLEELIRNIRKRYPKSIWYKKNSPSFIFETWGILFFCWFSLRGTGAIT